MEPEYIIQRNQKPETVTAEPEEAAEEPEAEETEKEDA